MLDTPAKPRPLPKYHARTSIDPRASRPGSKRAEVVEPSCQSGALGMQNPVHGTQVHARGGGGRQ